LTKDDVWLKYKRFVLMNASVRGPFVPHWAAACWSDRLLSKVTEDVKVCGFLFPGPSSCLFYGRWKQMLECRPFRRSKRSLG
jgi:hypothetical protein